MELLKIKPAAKRLKLSEMHFRNLIRDRQWPTYNLGPKGLRVDLDEILKLTRQEKRKKIARKRGES
jgi:hypothetical protein